MAQSLINAKELLARMPADGGVAGGGGENPQCIAIGAGDTPHDFKPGRTANNTSAKADDELAEAGEDISADQEELVLAVAGLAVYFAKQGINKVDVNPSVGEKLPTWEKDSDVPGMEYLQGALNNLTNSTVGSVSDYERRMEKYILKNDAVSNAFGAVTTVYIQDVLSSWEKWSAIPDNGDKPERPQFWCDICGKSTDAVSKALINKTIDLKWNPNDPAYDPNKVYKSGKKTDEKYLRVLANFMLTYMHPEDNAGSMKAVFVFDMGSGSVGKTLTVLPQVKNAIIPQVVSDSACTSMKQLDKGRNMLWFPVTAGDKYEYQANIFTYPLGIRYIMEVSSPGGPAAYNNRDDSVADNFKITIKHTGGGVTPGSFKAIAKNIFGPDGQDTVVLDFLEDASNVGPSVAYLASLIYAIRNNIESLVSMANIPRDLRATNPTSSNMINISEQFAQLADNINGIAGVGLKVKQQAFAILCFMLFDIKRSGDWEQVRACFYIPEDVVGKPMFCTGDILCGVFARMIGANSIWRSPKGNVKEWNFRIHRKVNKALDPDVIAAIASVQKCTEITKILGFTSGLTPLQRELQEIMVAAAQAATEGLFILPNDSENVLRIRTQQIITYLARIRALDIYSHAKTIQNTLGDVTDLYAKSFPAARVDPETGALALGSLSENEIEETFIVPLKTLINMFYATGNPQPSNAASFNKKTAIETYKQLYSPVVGDANGAVLKFKGAAANVQMTVEDPFLNVGPDPDRLPVRTDIDTAECMRRLDKLIQYEVDMKTFFAQRGDAAVAAQFGSLALALTRLATNANVPSIPFSELSSRVSEYGIRVKSVEKIIDRDGYRRYTTATEYDLGSKGGQLLRGNLFNSGFQSSTFEYAASDLQRLGSAIIQQFSGLTSAGGIRFKTSQDNYVGSDGFNNLRQYESIMGNRMANLDDISTLEKQLSQAQKEQDVAAATTASEQLQDARNKRIQIAPPAKTDEKDINDNDNKTQRLFCNSTNPGSWLSMTEEKGKRGSKYKLAVNDCLTLKNSTAASMIGTGMGYLSGFMRNSIWALDKNRDSFLVPDPDGKEANRNILYEGERRVQIALSKQNTVSTSGFRLFNMGKSEWNTLLSRGYKALDTPAKSVKLVLESKASLAIWFYGLFQLRGERSIVQQYSVTPPANINLMNAISRLAGQQPAGVDDPRLPWYTLATTLQDPVNNPFAIGWNWLGFIQDGIGEATQVRDYAPLSAGNLEGYKELIADVEMVLHAYKGCLPITYLVMALYAKQMELIFTDGERKALKKDDLTCGFIVSEAVKQCALYTGTTKEDVTIDDIIFAAMQLVMYGLKTSIPEPKDFPQSGGGHNDILQFGGSDYARIGDPLAMSTQNEIIQDLYLKVTGIAQGAISSLFSSKVPLLPDMRLAATAAATAITTAAGFAAPSETVTEVTIGTGFINLIGIITQHFQAQGLNPIDVFEKLMIALTVASRPLDPLPPRPSADVISIFQFVDTTQLNKIAQAMYAYGDEIRRVWSNGMQDVTDNESFEYTPTYIDLVLSTAFAYLGNKSGDTAPDSTYLSGIYNNGPLLNIPDAGNYLGPNTALANPNPALPGCNVMTGLPSMFSLYVYANGRTDIPELFDVGAFKQEAEAPFPGYEPTYYKGLFDQFTAWSLQYPSTKLLATSNGNPANPGLPTAVLQPSIVLYQLIKVCSSDSPHGPPPFNQDGARNTFINNFLTKLERASREFMADGGAMQGIISSMSSIPQNASVQATLPDNFIAPDLKNIQTLSLIGTLITPPRVKQVEEARQNVNDILLSNQLIGRRSEMDAALTDPDNQGNEAALRNLVDMVNQMNGYSLIDPASGTYFSIGNVPWAHLGNQYVSIDPSTGAQMILKPIPPLEYVGQEGLTMENPVNRRGPLDPATWLPYAQSIIAGNSEKAPYQTLFVTNQINQNYDVDERSKGFTENILANMAFNMTTANNATLATMANSTYFDTTWVTTRPDFTQDRILLLYRYILHTYPNTGQRGTQISDLLQDQDLRSLYFGGGSKNKTRKHKKKHNKTRREKKNIGNKTRGRDKLKKKRHTRKSD